jgi:hypothetical protein
MGEASLLQQHAAWALIAAYALSLVYELWRATAKAGTTRHDSMRTFLTEGLLLYVLATVVIVLLLVDARGAAWIGLSFAVVFILVSILYYNPRIMLEREPGLLDWWEDLLFTGLLFVAAVLLTYEVLGWSLATG